MEAVVDRENMRGAYKRVVGNKGVAGVDGMSVDELNPYLHREWSRIKEELLAGRFEPSPVRLVGIPKPGGGVRMLDIPDGGGSVGAAGCASGFDACFRLYFFRV